MELRLYSFRFAFYALLLIVLMGCGIQSVNEPHTFDPALEPTSVPTAVAIAKPTYIVERGTVSWELSLSGRIVPAAETAVSSPLKGSVAAVYFESGDIVQEGDLLAELDASSYQAERKLAQRALETAQVQVAALEAQQVNERRRAEIALQQMQIRLDFAITQGGENPTAEEQMAIDLLTLDVELAQLALDELEGGVDPTLLAEVEQAQLQLEELDTLLESTKLMAPVAGTVVRVVANAGDGVDSGETIIAIADLTKLEVESLVREVDLREMAEGMTATMNFAAQPGRSYEMVLEALAPPYGTAENLAELTARFAFVNSADSSDFEIGDRVVLDLILAQHDETLWLPQAAVRDFSGRNFVIIQEGDTQRRVDVKLGLEGSNRVEILEGVKEGNVIIGP